MGSNAEDFVCGSTKNVWKTDGHGKYSEGGGSIDKAAGEIARRLKMTLPPQKALAIDATKGKEIGADVVFLLNRSNWTTWRQYTITRQIIQATAHRLLEKNPNTRFYLAMYVGYSGSGIVEWIPVALYQDGFWGAIGSPSTPVESNMSLQPTLMVMMDALNDSDWKKGVTKSVVVFTNTGFSDPDHDISSVSVARRSVEIDPVNIFAVVPENLEGEFSGLTEATSGKVISASDSYDEMMIDNLIEAMTDRPTALLKNMEYFAEPGQEVIFDASDSYLEDGTIIKYEWDFDGDGTFEQTTTTPQAAHRYLQIGRQYMQVRVTGSNGAVANASASVKVNAPAIFTIPTAPINVTATVLSTAGRKSDVELSWEPPAPYICPEDGSCSYSFAPIASWVVSLNGVVLGKLDSDKKVVRITGVERKRDVTLSVAALYPGGDLGETTSVTLKKLPPVTPNSPIQDSSTSSASTGQDTHSSSGSVIQKASSKGANAGDFTTSAGRGRSSAQSLGIPQSLEIVGSQTRGSIAPERGKTSAGPVWSSLFIFIAAACVLVGGGRGIVKRRINRIESK
jgi:hypothetical protein